MSNFFNVIFTSFIFLTFSSFKSLAINILEKTEYYECQGDDEIKSFKLEIPSIFSSKSLQMYYDQAGNWTEVNANISKDKIVMPDWTSGSCGFKYIIFRLKDEKNKVNAKGVYIKDCDSYRKKDELHFITKCTTHLK